jgi:signal transduction histidine kinase
VKSIAEKHGGKVFAASEGEGEGATITMELPRSFS